MNAQVISSTQTYVRLPEAPSSVFVVTGDQIRRWGIRRISELVERLVPGAATAEDLDDIIVAFRGITADNNLKVLLLLNGHEYNTQWNNGPSSELELGLMDDIKRVEVLIGPHSALYGSGALIAVINMITRTGRDFTGVRVTGNYGTGQYRRGEFIFGEDISEDLNYFFSAGGLAADGYDNRLQQNISEFPPSWRLFGNVYFKGFELHSRYTRSARTLYVFPSGPALPDRRTNHDTFFLDGRRSFTPAVDLRLDLDFSYDASQTQRHDSRTGTKIRAGGEDRYTTKITGFYSGWKRHNLTLGASYRRDEFDDDWEGDNFNFNPVLRDGAIINLPSDFFSVRNFTPYGRNAYSFFGQDSIRLRDHVTILAGFRYDRIEAPQIRNPDLFSPRLAIVYTPNRKTVLKAMMTTGVSRVINAAVTSPDPIQLGNPTVLAIDKAEKMHSFELAGSFQPNPRMDFSLNVFLNSLRDIFGVDPTRIRTSPSDPFHLISVGRVDYVGFEAATSLNVTEDMFVRLVHQHVRTGPVVDEPFGLLITPDGHLNNYPENITKFLADARLHKNVSANLNANLVWNHHGFIRNPAPKTLDTGLYALVNANVVYNLNRNTELIFSGCNLLNYRKQISPFHFAGSRVFLPERNFNIQLSYRL